MPELGEISEGVIQDAPENWFQLPEEYFPTLIGLRDDADTALSAKFLV